MKSLLILLLFLPAMSRAEFQETIKPFVSKYCVKCHGPEKSKGDLRLDTLPPNMGTAETAEIWHNVLDELNFSNMPPEDEKIHPSKQELANVIGDLAIALDEAKQRLATSKKDVVLRRLNRREYIEAVEDLTGIRIPAEQVPMDGEEIFDTHGATLYFSAYQIEQYMQLARKVLDKAIVEPDQKPETYSWRVDYENTTYPLKGSQRKNLEIIQRRDKAEGLPESKTGYLFGCGVPVAGLVMLKTPSLNSENKRVKSYEPGLYKLRMRCGHSGGEGPFVFSLKKGIRGGRIQFAKHMKFIEVSQPLHDPEIVEIELNYTNQLSGLGIVAEANGKQKTGSNKLGYIWIDWLELSGPHFDQWPPTSHRRIFATTQGVASDDEYAKKILRDFAYKAFRFQNAEPSYLASLFSFYKAERIEGKSLREALKMPLMVILSSPRFLYLPENSTDNHINQREFANRLSLFLWASPPDKTLVDLAVANQLTKPAVLQKQLRRLMNHPNGLNLARGFVQQWLEFERIDATPPDPKKFPKFNLQVNASMRLETFHFFNHLLTENLSIRNFIDSDFTMSNGTMNRYYGLKGDASEKFYKVALPKEKHRGGLLGQASVLTLTSNGLRTSPVVRGAYVMDKLIGHPAPEPPQNVPALPETSQKGKKLDLRASLQSHVSQPQCSSCHKRIDPIGFGLENFDAVGLWRGGQDTNGNLPNGQAFSNLEQLKAALVKYEDDFARAFVEHLASYAFGRPVGFADRSFIDGLLSKTKPGGYKLGDIVIALIISDEFRSKHGTGGGTPLSVTAQKSELHTFHNSDRSRSFVAALLKYDNSKRTVTVRRSSDGKELTFSIDHLHADDQSYVRKHSP